jgi:hypothetical protein
MSEKQMALDALLHLIQARNPEFSTRDIAHYARMGEPRLALENLVDNLHELGVVLEPEIRAELAAICKLFGVDPSYWGHLESDR